MNIAFINVGKTEMLIISVLFLAMLFFIIRKLLLVYNKKETKKDK